MPKSSWNKGIPVSDTSDSPLDFSAFGTVVEDGKQVAGQPRLNDPIKTLSSEELEFDGPFGDRDFDVYAEAVGQIESAGRYDSVGGYNGHYQGKYQFGRLALKDVGIGFSVEAREAFRNDPELQETAFHSFTLQNHKTLSRLSGKYRSLNSREQLGILALAHNAGAGGALSYLRTGEDTTDGFGTKGTKYVNAVAKAFKSRGA